MKKILAALILMVSLLPLKADEGMWLLPLLEKLNIGQMQEMGLELSAEDIYSINNSSLKDAIVIFGRGCTGELISEEGLILTNHHCGYGVIQQHSSVDNDYLKDGFWAASKEEEIASPGLSVTFLRGIKDVTNDVMADVNEEMSAEVYKAAIDSAIKVVKEGVEDTTLTLMVKPFYAGNKYYLFTYEKYTDVRFVGAPPSSIGKFGADTDNWMWPRHTGDFSLFRVYGDKDGKPAEYSEDNVPLKPKHHLPVSLRGNKIGDFAMTMGYPGSTDRYLTSWGIDERMNVINDARIVVRKVKQDIWLREMQKEQKVRIQYASKYARSSNYYKNSIGMNKGLINLNVPAKKAELEKAFTAWTNTNPKGEAYKDALGLLENAYTSRRDDIKNYYYLSECFKGGTEIFTFAKSIASKIKAKADKNDVLKAVEKFYKDYNPSMDEEVLAAMLNVYAENISKDHPAIYEDIKGLDKESYEKYAFKLFKKSVFADYDKLVKLIEGEKWKKILKDPAVKDAATITAHSSNISKAIKSYTNDVKKGKRLFEAGLHEMNPDKVYYPDANFTQRLSFGKVGDYIPRDAVKYSHFTTLKGVMEKEDPNNWEFVVPSKLKELYEAKDYGNYADKDGTLHVCFTTDNDITGGNSGSPVINAKGHLFGLAFDGNWEAMSGDIAFEPELQKCINVDIRYVLFVIDKFAGAKHLVDEMTIIE